MMEDFHWHRDLSKSEIPRFHITYPSSNLTLCGDQITIMDGWCDPRYQRQREKDTKNHCPRCLQQRDLLIVAE